MAQARIGQALKDKIFSFSDSLSDTLARADIRQLFYRGAPDGDKARTIEKMPRTAENLDKKRTEIRKILEIADSHKKIHKLTFSPKEFDAYAARGGTAKTAAPAASAPAQPPKAPPKAAQNRSRGVAQGTAAKKVSSALPGASTGVLPKSKRGTVQHALNTINKTTRTEWYIPLGDLIQAFFEKTMKQIESALLALQSPASHEELKSKTPDEISKIKQILEDNKEKISKFHIMLADINLKVPPPASATPTATPPKSTVHKMNLGDLPISLSLYA